MNHHVNMRCTTGVVTRVDSGDLHNPIRVCVPTTTEPGLRAVESGRIVRAVVASCIGW